MYSFALYKYIYLNCTNAYSRVETKTKICKANEHLFSHSIVYFAGELTRKLFMSIDHIK